MSKKINKLGGILLSGLVLTTILFGQPVYGYEAGDQTQLQGIETEAYTDAQEIHSINFTYIMQQVIVPEMEQQVAIDVTGAGNYAKEDIRLVMNTTSGEKQVTCSELIEDTMVFSFTLDELGEVELLKVYLGNQEIGIAEENRFFMVAKNIQELETINQQQIHAQMQEALEAKTQGYTIVVIDPGHDQVHCGAAGNGLREEILTLKISQYCKEELLTYSKVKVYMTREDGSCLYPSSNGICMQRRCEYAGSLKADLLVSMHIDAGSSTRTGGMAIVADLGRYRDDLAQVTQDAGKAMLKELEAYGLPSRGLYVRISDSSGDEYHYPNGAKADWYSITRNCIKNGVPGIIMEHGFISNPSDVSKYLSSDEKLRGLGVADATGIAKYFALKKGPDNSIPKALYDHSGLPYTDTAKNVPTFVAEIYGRVLERTPVRHEVSYWVDTIYARNFDGTTLVKNFLNCPEFTNKNYTDEEYVDRLYETVLGRSADPTGKAFWTARLTQGTPRLRLADEFLNCPEFERYCVAYGMKQKNNQMQYSKLYPKLAEFADGYYQGMLYRKGEPEGVEHWCRRFLLEDASASTIVAAFAKSPEFVNKACTKEEFVEGLYNTFLHRNADAAGKAYWVQRLGEGSLEEKLQVIKCFLYTEEYSHICEQYGIFVGQWTS